MTLVQELKREMRHPRMLKALAWAVESGIQPGPILHFRAEGKTRGRAFPLSRLESGAFMAIPTP
jgi:hypothetical protein